MSTFSARVLTSQQKPFEDGEPYCWYDNKLSVTVLFHCLSAVFPEGEAFFVRSVSRYIKDSNTSKVDKELLRNAKAFISQETHHGIEHRSYNRKIAQKYKHDMDEKEAHVKTILQGIENTPYYGHIYALACTCSLEHMTATLAEVLLGTSGGRFMLDRMAPSVYKLLI
jgi:predicted metal-dependent hydrolase